MLKDFLTRLDENLHKSIDSFNALLVSYNNDPENDILECIDKTMKKMNTYLNLLKTLENKIATQDLNVSPNLELDNEHDIFKKKFKNSILEEIKKNNPWAGQTIKEMPPVKETVDITAIDSAPLLPSKLNIQVVNSIKEIPPMFYWFAGDKYYKEGIYTCMTPGFYSRVPFPNTIPSSNNKFRINSMPCKYYTKQSCAEAKRRNSVIYNSDIRECSYLHCNEKFIKIGTQYRCNIESFGNHETLNYDMNYISNTDIKKLLLYSLSDSLLTALWYQNKFKNGDLILTNIDTYTR